MLNYLMSLSLIVLFEANVVKLVKADAFESNGGKYFPTDRNTLLVYKSSFGQTISKFYYNQNYLMNSNEGDRFKYVQKIIINEEGVFVIEVYQYFKLMLLISKENSFTYNEPVLRLPFPIIPGKTWKWKGIEYSNGDASEIELVGKVFDKEIVKTPAGNFEAIKVETKIISSSGSENIITEWYAENAGLIKAVISINGGGLMGIVRDLFGYGTIEFDLLEIRRN